MKCFKCGYEIPDDAAYCTECGTYQPNSAASSSNGTWQQTQATPTEPWQQQPHDAAWQQSSQGEQTVAWQQAEPQQVMPGAAYPQPSTQAAPKKSSYKAAVGICVAAAAICAICVGIFAFGPHVDAPDSSTASATATQTAGATDTETQETPSEAAKPSDETQPADDSATVAEAIGNTDDSSANTANDQNAPSDNDNLLQPPSRTDEQGNSLPSGGSAGSGFKASFIDLADPGDYYDINIFLSNFAEWPSFYSGYKYGGFDRNHPDQEQLANWGMWHNAINNDGTLESGSYELSGAPASSWSKEISGGNPREWLRRMETDRVEGSIERYTGLTIDLTGYDSGDGAYFEQDGYLYEGLYRGSADDTCRVLLANSVEDADNGLVRVEFTIYTTGRDARSLPADKSWYGMGDSELRSAMRAAGIEQINTIFGEALVASAGEGAQTPFTLASFQVR